MLIFARLDERHCLPGIVPRENEGRLAAAFGNVDRMARSGGEGQAFGLVAPIADKPEAGKANE
jgi:hypothetical protein